MPHHELFCNTLKQLFVFQIMTLTVRLPETIESQLARFCEAMGVSKSQVVQTALKDWFAKPAPDHAHPLLAFAQAASNAAPAPDWAGSYSKERLRTRVLASGGAHAVNESVAEYRVTRKKTSALPKSADKKLKNNSVKPSNNKGQKAIYLKNPNDAAAAADGV